MQNGINKIFDLFDDDHTGFIKSSNIRRVAKELGETMNVQELEEMLQRAASNGREISREDFYNIMTKKSFWFSPYAHASSFSRKLASFPFE